MDIIIVVVIVVDRSEQPLLPLLQRDVSALSPSPEHSQLLSRPSHVLSDDVIHLYHVTF